jgi:hypothetical protein
MVRVIFNVCTSTDPDIGLLWLLMAFNAEGGGLESVQLLAALCARDSIGSEFRRN